MGVASSKNDEPEGGRDKDEEANRKRKSPEEVDGEDSSVLKVKKAAVEKETGLGLEKEKDNITMVEFRFESMPPYHYTYSGYIHVPMVQDPKTGALSLPKLTPETEPMDVPMAFTWPPDLQKKKEEAAFPVEKWREMKRCDETKLEDDGKSDEFKLLCFQHNSIIARLVPVTVEEKEGTSKEEEEDDGSSKSGADNSKEKDDGRDGSDFPSEQGNQQDDRKPSPAKLRWSLQLGFALLGSNTISAYIPSVQHSWMEVIKEDKDRINGLCANDLDEWVSKAGGELVFEQSQSGYYYPSSCEFYFTLSEERPGEDTWKEELRHQKQSSGATTSDRSPQWDKLKTLLKTRNLDWSESEVETRLREYKRYMALCILKQNEKQSDEYDGDDDIDELSPSPQVDKIWHCHLLFPAQYRRDVEAFASQIFEPTALFRHRPYLEFDTRKRYERTLGIFDEDSNLGYRYYDSDLVKRLNKIVGSKRAADCWPDADDAYEEARGGGCG